LLRGDNAQNEFRHFQEGYRRNADLPDRAGPGTALAHQQIDAVERDVPENFRPGFLEYSAREN